MKVGDKVRVKDTYPDYEDLRGMEGVVVSNEPKRFPTTPVCVQFRGRKDFGLHVCQGLTPLRDGRWFNPRDLELVGPPAFNIKMAIDLESVDEATALATKLAEITGKPVQVIHV